MRFCCFPTSADANSCKDNRTATGRRPTLTYLVNGMSRGSRDGAIATAVNNLAGISAGDVDLRSKPVVVRGEGIDDDAVLAAIGAAGYRPVTR